MTSPAKSTSRTFYDHSNDRWFTNQYTESTGATVEPVPYYLKQRQGAFPDSNYAKYDNKPSSSSSCKQKSGAEAKERTKRTLVMSLDPLDPANSLKHKRGPKASGSPPVPVVYLPPRAHDTVKKQKQDWRIPPHEIRIESYTRGIYTLDGFSDNFAKVSEVLRLAAQRAREANSMRSETQKEMEKERGEQELRASGDARGDYESESDADTEPTGQTEA